MTSPGSSSPRRAGGRRDRREPARVAILTNLLQGGNISPAARKAHHRKYDAHVPMTVSEFLARAWKLANDKARAGWIV
jgi:hypothetical protein